MKQPCKRDCPRRVPGCGATCPDWQKYVKERNAKYDERRLNSEYNACKHEVMRRVVHRRFMKHCK